MSLRLKPLLPYDTPVIEVSNIGYHYLDGSKESKSKMRNRILFRSWRTASGQVELEKHGLAKLIYVQIAGLQLRENALPIRQLCGFVSHHNAELTGSEGRRPLLL